MTTDGHGHLLSALEQTAYWLCDALALVDENDASASRSDGEWSLADVVYHLRASDAIVATRIMQIVVRPGSPLTAYDDVLWAKALRTAAIPLDEQRLEFELRRTELIGVLRNLSEDQWQLSGEHEVRGPMTVAQIAAMIAEHEAEHRAQVEVLVAAAHRS